MLERLGVAVEQYDAGDTTSGINVIASWISARSRAEFAQHFNGYRPPQSLGRSLRGRPAGPLISLLR